MSDMIGPKIPDHLVNQKKAKSIGPTLPPGWKKDDESDTEDGQVIGPAMPPGWRKESEDTSQSQSQLNGEAESDSDEESMIGPLLPTAASLLVEENRHRSKDKKVNQREEWMTVIPESSPLAAKLGFGKSMTSFSSKPPPSSEMNSKDSVKETEIRETIATYNDKKRPSSLVDMHQKEKKQKKDKDAPKKRELFEFDPEQDLKVRQMDSQQTKSIVDKAKLMNSRFYSGSQKFL
ncbi:GPALPP motifs-containing protein 1 [Brevipalpus obovatus]|uniref:GPALPP motifs-containing protein 1 n=1 Tax=Brevipalpus obovatus TaxID=246614 RepID=UPI003D9E4271